jgi:putative ABC transport system ATP-binding protein
MALIEFKNVKKEYVTGDLTITAIDSCSFSVEKGELVVILGPSGAGKTTVLNLLGGMDSPSGGSIMVDNNAIHNFSKKELVNYRRNDIGFVFQFYNLVGNLTTLENVELACQICPDSLDPKIVLEQVGLSERLGNFPAQLSGGEQQRVAIARAAFVRRAYRRARQRDGAAYHRAFAEHVQKNGHDYNFNHTQCRLGGYCG